MRRRPFNALSGGASYAAAPSEPPTPAMMPRELLEATVFDMEPGDRGWISRSGVHVDFDLRTWVDATTTVYDGPGEDADIHIHCHGGGCELFIPHYWVFKRSVLQAGMHLAMATHVEVVHVPQIDGSANGAEEVEAGTFGT